MIISLKVNKKTENYIINNNSIEEYEKLLRQVESELRKHIRDTIDMIISLKVNKMTESINKKNENDEYEKLLRQLESELRKNIAIQNQLKVQLEKMQLDVINNEAVSYIF